MKEQEYERQARNQKHLKEPQVGDYWHEMFSPILLVIGVNGPLVTYVDQDHINREENYFDTKKAPHIIPWTAFVAKLSYDHLPATWADVLPGRTDMVEDLLARYAEEEKAA